MLDAPGDDEPWQALDASQRRQRTLDAVRRLVLRESQEQPLVLVVEDLHWIDSETQALLDLLVESVPSTRLLLLVNYRPEYRHGWGNRPTTISFRSRRWWPMMLPSCSTAWSEAIRISRRSRRS